MPTAVWEACVLDLCVEWPALPPLVLSAVIDRLLKALRRGSHEDEACRRLVQWAAAVLPSAGLPLAALYNMIAEAARAFLAALRAPEATAAPAVAALAAVLRHMQSTAASAPKGERGTVRSEAAAAALALDQALAIADHLAGLRADAPPAKKQKTAGAGGGSGSAMDLLAEALAAKERAGMATALASAPASAEDRDYEAALPPGGPSGFFWERCDQWAACPLGTLPSALDPMLGALPDLTTAPIARGAARAAPTAVDRPSAHTAAAVAVQRYEADYEGFLAGPSSVTKTTAVAAAPGAAPFDHQHEHEPAFGEAAMADASHTAAIDWIKQAAQAPSTFSLFKL